MLLSFTEISVGIQSSIYSLNLFGGGTDAQKERLVSQVFDAFGLSTLFHLSIQSVETGISAFLYIFLFQFLEVTLNSLRD